MEETGTPAQIEAAQSPDLIKQNLPLKIKTEPSATPRSQSPSSAIPPNFDAETAKAIAAAQNEYSTRRVSRKPIIDKLPSPEPEIKPSSGDEKGGTTPTGTASKKRPAPRNSKTALPDGIKKPPPKKRKLEPSGSEDGATPAPGKRSATPASTTANTRGGKASKRRGSSRKASITGTPASSSPAPATSPAPPSEADQASDVEDDAPIYCICRRPDNHTWMVACDGGCDDWFHGKCVNISKDDQDLIDKYICPFCTAKEERGVTTWKPMCRRDGCRKPARLRKGSASKYCSDECGVLFMKMKSERARLDAAGVKRRATAEEPDLGPLGGAIRADELKTLALAVPDATTFRGLGDSPVLDAPGTTKSPEIQKSHLPNGHDVATSNGEAEPTATNRRLLEISHLKTTLRARRALLQDRERLVTLTKERAAKLAAQLKMKDLCGYDPRLSWDEVTFREWREGKEGSAVFVGGSLDVVVEEQNGAEDVNGEEDDVEHGRRPKPRRTTTSETATSTTHEANGVCMRRRCQRHTAWQKLALHDVRFEEAETRAEMRRVDEEEKGIREIAASGGAGIVEGGESETVGDGEGIGSGEVGREVGDGRAGGVNGGGSGDMVMADAVVAGGDGDDGGGGRDTMSLDVTTAARAGIVEIVV